MERLREHSSALLETLRGTQSSLAEEADRARAAADEAESLRRRSSLLSDENAALRSNSARREEQHREELAQWEGVARAAQLAEVTVREEAAEKVGNRVVVVCSEGCFFQFIGFLPEVLTEQPSLPYPNDGPRRALSACTRSAAKPLLLEKRPCY